MPKIKKKRAKRLTQFRKQANDSEFLPRYPSGSVANYKKYGKKFVKLFMTRQADATRVIQTDKEKFGVNLAFNGHESHCVITLTYNSLLSGERYLPHKIADLKIGFEESTLIVEAMQTDKNRRVHLNRFRNATKGTPPLDFMLHEAEKTARRLGFREIKIRKPETLYYYHLPVSTQKDSVVQHHMKVLYGRIARANGFSEEEFFYVKKL